MGIQLTSHFSKAEALEQQDEESSEDDIIIPSSHRKRRVPADTDDSVEDIPRPHRRLKRKAESSPIVLSDSEDAEESVVSSPVKRRRRVADSETPQTPRDSTDQDQLDIQEDLKDLQDSGTASRVFAKSRYMIS